MRKLFIPVFVTFFLYGSGCQPAKSESETQFAVATDAHEAKNALIVQLLSGNTKIRACIVNEDPLKNKEWVSRVEKAFRSSVNMWLKEGSKHPKYPLPSSDKVTFSVRSLTGEEYRKVKIRSKEEVEEYVRTFKPLVQELLNAPDAILIEKWEMLAKKLEKFQEERFSPPAGCAAGTVMINSFSDISELALHLNLIQKAADSVRAKFMSESDVEIISRRIFDLTYKGSVSYNEFKRRISEREEKKEELYRANANFSGPILNIHGTYVNDLEGVFNHELGHLFGLGDVYEEKGFDSALKHHPNALMRNGYDPKVNHQIQPDDIAGLFTVINIIKSKNPKCADGYNKLENDKDIRSSDTLYCIPNNFRPDFTVEPSRKVEVDSEPAATRISPASDKIDIKSAIEGDLRLRNQGECPDNKVKARDGICCPKSSPQYNVNKDQCTKSAEPRLP
jgi:hypothetical protein